MQAVLQVTAGPHAGQRIVLHTGLAFRLGRTTKADYAIPEDTYLSGAHFCVEWSGDACVVRDLKSSNGTYLNGTRMSEGLLQDGDIITAGQSSFAFLYEQDANAALPVHQAGQTATMTMRSLLPDEDEDTSTTSVPGPIPTPLPLSPMPLTPTRAFTPPAPPPPRPAQAPQAFSVRTNAVLSVLRGLADPVAALLDAQAASQCIERARASGATVEYLSDSGPCVFLLDPDAPLSGALVSDAWGNGWGIYLTSRQPLIILRNHLRRFSSVLTQDGVELRLRLSNPALMRAFLPGLSGDEAKAFFGPVAGMLMEGPNADELLMFVASASGALHKSVSLGADAAGS